VVTLVEVRYRISLLASDPTIPRLRLAAKIFFNHASCFFLYFQISRATLTRAGLKLYSFTSCIPALRNYKSLYFDILRALQERQDVIVDCDNLRGSETTFLGGLVGSPRSSPTHNAATDRVSRLLMPLSTWLVIHQGDSSSATPFSTPASLNRDTMPSLVHPETFHLQHTRKSSHIRRPSATAHPATAAPEELMPRTLSPLQSPLFRQKRSFYFYFMTHLHIYSAVVTASPVPAASHHHTTRLAFTSGGGPHW
jgi:hypothetical protein